jgi:hypothetical protein
VVVFLSNSLLFVYVRLLGCNAVWTCRQHESTRRYDPDGQHLHRHRNLKSHLTSNSCRHNQTRHEDVVWLRARQSGFDPRQGQRIFLLAPASIPALGPTQPPIQWVSKGVKRGRDVTLTTHPHLVPGLSMSRSYTSSPPLFLHGV